MFQKNQKLFAAFTLFFLCVYATNTPLCSFGNIFYESGVKLLDQTRTFLTRTINTTCTFVHENPGATLALTFLASASMVNAYSDYPHWTRTHLSEPDAYNTETCEGFTLTKEYADLMEKWDALYDRQKDYIKENFLRYIRPKMCCISSLLSFNNPTDIVVSYCNAQRYNVYNFIPFF